MSEMVERIARAVCDQYPGKCCKEYIQTERCDRPPESAFRIARAAIKAMSEPTEKMLEDSGMVEGYDIDNWTVDADKAHTEWWQAMLTAALEDD